MDIKALFEDLYQEMDLELENILEFWSLQTIDNRFGGFIGQINNQGEKNILSSKGTVLNARILWTFSAAYNLVGSEKLEKLATRAYNYLTRYFWDMKNGGLFWEVDHEGKPLNTRKQAYAQGFGIYAFSEYYLATGNEESLQYAIRLFNLLEDHFYDPEHGGYLEALDQEWNRLDDMRLSKKDVNAPKSMNTHLHILEPYTNLYRAWPEDRLKESIQHVIGIFLEKIIDKKTKHLNLFFDMDWTCKSDTISFGHSIEGAWLLREAALEAGDEQVLNKVQKAAVGLADAVLSGGTDKDGSIFYEYENEHLDTDKHWWAQAEAIVGLTDAWEITGDHVYLEAMKKVWSFIKENIIDYENGEWFGRVDKNGIPYESEDKVGFWKCPYHNTRAMIEMLRRIRNYREATI